jgi:hypothetical protein
MIGHRPVAANIRFPVQPRLVPAIKAARFLHLTLAEFRNAMPALHREGFPKACTITGHYDLVAIEAWQDRRSGLTKPTGTPADTDALIRERLANLG